MKKIFTTLMILGASLSSFSQKLDTVYRNAGYGQMEHVGLFKESNGNVIMAGTYASGINDIDPGSNTVPLPPANNFGFYLIKYNDLGSYLGHMSVSGTANVLAQDAARDASGNYIIVGEFTGTTDFDPSANAFTVNSGTSQGKAFIAKYDANFNFLSVYTFTATNYSAFQSVKVDAAGKIYVGGYFFGTQDFDVGIGVASETSVTTGSNVFLIYDSSMNLLNRFVNFGRFKTLCEVDNSGNIYLAGLFNANSDFDPSPSTYTLTPIGGSDVFIAKYNSSMVLQWAGQIGNTNSENLKQLKLDGNGNPILLGEFSGTVDFDMNTSSAYTLTSVATDNFLVRISAFGLFNWARHYQLSTISSNVTGDYVNVDSNNNIYLTGAFSGTKNFNNGGTAFNMVATGDVDGFIEKLDNAGTQQWCFRFGGSTPGFNYTGGHCISIENSGQINLIGSMRVVNDFDPSPYDSTSTAPYGSFYNSFIAKYNQLKTLTVATPSLCAGITLAVPYSINGTCNVGNIFTAQLSDASGSFASPISIGTISATSSGTITATVPSTVAYGTNYRVRVVSSNPIQKGERNNSNILINNVPSVLSSPSSKTVCINANTSFTSAVSSNSNTVQWYFNSSPVSTGTAVTLSLSNVQPSNSGNYYLTVTNGCGSSNSNAVTLTVNSPTVSVAGLTSICAGQSTTLTASGAINYSWNTGSNSSSITATPSANTNYTVTGIDGQGCIDTETLTVILNALPTLSVSISNSVICSGETSTLTASGANTYTWSTSQILSDISVTPSVTSIYSVIGTDANGCSASTTKTLVVNSLPNIISSTSNTLLCVGQSATLTSTGANSYTWSTTENTTSIAVSPTIQTTYTVIGTDVNGCSNSSIVTQSVSLCTVINQLINESSVSVFPNPFNDVITIRNSFENYNIIIVDVLGKVVFEKQTLTTETNIDLSELKTGFYHLVVKGDGRSYTQKIIKQ
jgi:hypothetical protein